MIPVVDIFAGPGGLGEGFSGWRDSNGKAHFQLALSIEKDAFAHATLRLRAFRRLFGERAPLEYDQHVAGAITWDALVTRFPAAGMRADEEALRLELESDTSSIVRALIKHRVPRGAPWVLIGGPPCQAYSIVGRSRNKGVRGYVPELDHRQKLYVEYLQILADHAPPIFVMENVKGLLSARLHRQGLFESIRNDLRDPVTALRRENRSVGRHRPRYSVRAVVPPSDLFSDDPEGYVIKAEKYGVPQRRHRVVLLGVRNDVDGSAVPQMQETKRECDVNSALRKLPRLRSGLSKEPDSAERWVKHLKSAKLKKWFAGVASDVQEQISLTLEELVAPRANRGSEYSSSSFGIVLNHATRSHIAADLDRYLFASSFAAVTGQSPVLSDFPKSLLPNHENVLQALGNGLFSDRFRVQVGSKPATTITAHISKDGHYYIHPDPSQCRTLTVREAARLQTFPDDYFFCGPRTSQYHQVGNAVPPVLAEQIANIVAQILRS